MVRVLLCGDIKGQLPLLCDHVSKLHARLDEAQHFKAIFCVGEFSSEDMDLDCEPPVPIYFVDAGPACGDLIEESPQGDELQPGLNFLGHFGVAKIAGLSVAFLSGRYRADLFPEEEEKLKEKESAPGNGVKGAAAPPEESAPQTWEQIRAAEKVAEVARTQLYVDGLHYTPLAVERLVEDINLAGGVDLLLTCEWPAGCQKGLTKEQRAGVDKATYQRCGSPAVARVAAAAEPKYHAVGLADCFWRRLPWTHERRGEVDPQTGQLRAGACRIVALGSAPAPTLPAAAASGAEASAPPAAGVVKPQQKWIHGLDLDPDAPPAPAPDATLSPWSDVPAPAPHSDAGGPLRLNLADCMEGEEKQRWLKRFGVMPTELQQASDKVVKELQPKEKKEKRQSIYWNQKSDKRFKAGKGSGDSFAQKERRASMGRSAGTF